MVYPLSKWIPLKRWWSVNVCCGLAPLMNFFLSLLAKVGKTYGGGQGHEKERILVLLFGRIGDIIVSIPAVRALRKGFPEAYIACLTSDNGIEIMKGCPYVDEVINNANQGLFLRYFVMCLKLRNLHFDTAVFLRPPFDIHQQLIPYLAGVPQRIGLGFQRFLMQNAVKILTHKCFIKSRNQVESVLDIVRNMGIKEVETELELWISEKERDFIKQYLIKEGIEATDLLIGIHPGAGQTEKRWPAINFAEVGDALFQEYGAKIVITGGPSEVKLAEYMAKSMKSKPVVAAGKLTLLQLAALIKECHLFLTNDTGPMHITIAVKTPLIALFGPTDPHQWVHHWVLENEKNIILRNKELICGLRTNCAVYKTSKESSLNPAICSSIGAVCVNSIPVEVVIQAAAELIERNWGQTTQRSE